ncbi:hypothetical protein D7Y41_28640 [Anaerotruncus sp. 1XD22-93]|nr:hypothetical protein [Lachnospiraceae bacterium]NBI76770.1 hypothetical protein [Lachnospiraceae bacterium]RKJ78920.1 hypothetical protein D7Y41_28640 [Anaerotruncus sp. 1XD22-93]
MCDTIIISHKRTLYIMGKQNKQIQMIILDIDSMFLQNHSDCRQSWCWGLTPAPLFCMNKISRYFY